MDKKTVKYVGIFAVGFLVFFLANYFFLKSTVEWPEIEVEPDTLEEEQWEEEVGEERDELYLIWDISGKAGPRDKEIKELQEKKEKEEEEEQRRREEEQRRQREEMLTIADSVTVEETFPIIEELDVTQEEVVVAQEDISALGELLAELAAQADSIDQVKAKRFSQIVATMKPTEAAAILNQLSSRTNAEILLKMRQKSAAKILAALPRERAAEVARHLSRAYARSTL